MLRRILHGIRDIEVAVDVVNAVRRKARRRVGIREIAVDIGGVARVGYGAVEQHGGEGAVIDVDRAGPEIGGEEMAAMHIDAEGQTLIDRAVVGADMRIVDDDGRGGAERAVPGDDRTVLRVEDEIGGGPVSGDDEARRTVPEDAGRRRGAVGIVVAARRRRQGGLSLAVAPRSVRRCRR